MNGLVTYDRQVVKVDPPSLRRWHSELLSFALRLGGAVDEMAEFSLNDTVPDDQQLNEVSSAG